MCRNIRTLHNFDPPATEEEIQASALQYVRKISGSTKPSQANAEAFDEAVEAIASTASSNASALAWEGLVEPLILRTYCRAEAWISSSVAGGSKLWRVLMFLHMDGS